MYNESGNIFLTEFVTCKLVHILRPFLDFWSSGYVPVTWDVLAIIFFNFLVTESEFTHPVSGALKDDINHRIYSPGILVIKTFVWVFDPSFFHAPFYTSVDGIRLIQRSDNSTWLNLEVKLLS